MTVLFDGDGLLYLWLLLSCLARQFDVEHAMFYLCLDVTLVYIVGQYEGLLELSVRELSAQILALFLVAAFSVMALLALFVVFTLLLLVIAVAALLHGDD